MSLLVDTVRLNTQPGLLGFMDFMGLPRYPSDRDTDVIIMLKELFKAEKQYIAVRLFLRLILTPSLPHHVISGLKDARRRLQTVYFLVL